MRDDAEPGPLTQASAPQASGRLGREDARTSGGATPRITATTVRTWELDRTPDLVDMVSAARDAGHEVMLFERPMPDAVSVAAIGRSFDMVAAPGGVAVENARGEVIDFEGDDDRILAAARLWRRLASPETIAVGGFAYRPDREPSGPWAGFPALLFRIPELAIMRRRGRTFVFAATEDAASLMDLAAAPVQIGRAS